MCRSIILLSFLLATAYGQSLTGGCGQRYTTTAVTLTINSEQKECMYFLDSNTVAVSGTSQTLETNEAISFFTPTSTGSTSLQIAAAPFTNVYKPARTVAIYKDAGGGTANLVLSYTPTAPSGTTETSFPNTNTCGGLITASSGTITQPTGSSQLNCIWIFPVDATKNLNLNVTSFTTTGACGVDFLQINNFDSNGLRTRKEYCGSAAPGSNVVETWAVVRYVSGASGPVTTFNLNYAIVAKSGAPRNFGSFNFISLMFGMIGIFVAKRRTQM